MTYVPFFRILEKLFGLASRFDLALPAAPRPRAFTLGAVLLLLHPDSAGRGDFQTEMKLLRRAGMESEYSLEGAKT